MLLGVYMHLRYDDGNMTFDMNVLHLQHYNAITM